MKILGFIPLLVVIPLATNGIDVRDFPLVVSTADNKEAAQYIVSIKDTTKLRRAGEVILTTKRVNPTLSSSRAFQNYQKINGIAGTADYYVSKVSFGLSSNGSTYQIDGYLSFSPHADLVESSLSKINGGPYER